MGPPTHLGLGVVRVLLVAADDGPPLVGVVQGRDIIADDAAGAGVDEGLDAGLLAGTDDRVGAIDIDPLEEVLVVGVVDGDGGRRVDDDVGFEVLDGGQQAVLVGDVALGVGGGRVAVLLAAQVNGGDVRGGPVAEGLVDDVVAQEAVAAHDEHAAEVASRFRGHGGCEGEQGNCVVRVEVLLATSSDFRLVLNRVIFWGKLHYQSGVGADGGVSILAGVKSELQSHKGPPHPKTPHKSNNTLSRTKHPFDDTFKRCIRHYSSPNETQKYAEKKRKKQNSTAGVEPAASRFHTW